MEQHYSSDSLQDDRNQTGTHTDELWASITP